MITKTVDKLCETKKAFTASEAVKRKVRNNFNLKIIPSRNMNNNSKTFLGTTRAIAEN